MNNGDGMGRVDRRHRTAHLGLASAVLVPAVLYACGGSGGTRSDGGTGASSGGDGSAGSCNGSGLCLTGGSSSGGGSNSSGSSSGSRLGMGTAMGTYAGAGCTGAGCTFPSTGAPACASSAPAIKVVYPNTGVLVPPNMNVISVQWTPYGSAYKTFEVDFSNSVTDVRVTTTCPAQTMDTSVVNGALSPQPSGGCDLELPQAAWTNLENANRGNGPVTITVRGTTDGTCATGSQDSIKLSFAQEDLLGAIYYWKSCENSACGMMATTGTGGQIWRKSFGDMTPEQQVTGTSGSALSASCNGCHVLSRDGQRMVVSSDDNDSDDEYSDVLGSLIDLSMNVVVGGTGGGRVPGTQPPGFSTISPTHAYYLTSDGLGTAPTNNFVLYNGNTAAQVSTITFGNAADRPTMPDWSPDGTKVIYDLPNMVAAWDQGGGGRGGRGGGGGRTDDDHMFGGSLWVLPYNGAGSFGTPSVFLQSSGENNYYPSYSPDGQFVVFDRAPSNTSVATIDGCTNSGQPGAMCPNDSFSNPAARLMLISTLKNATPVDLQNANGSPAAAPQPLSNSWPRWSPFVQMYRGGSLLWVAFSSTRDYGVLVRNHLSGMYQCYPPDSYMQPGGSHGMPFPDQCQQPKLWMAAISLSEPSNVDPSFPAFYLPFQDITKHNHTPQWTQEVVTMPVPETGMCIGNGGSCINNPNACCPPAVCNGNGTCTTVVM
jgi:hypothetical protein